jgi:hypothetical protein
MPTPAALGPAPPVCSSPSVARKGEQGGTPGESGWVSLNTQGGRGANSCAPPSLFHYLTVTGPPRMRDDVFVVPAVTVQEVSGTKYPAVTSAAVTVCSGVVHT